MVSSKGTPTKAAGTDFDLLQLLEWKEQEFKRLNRVKLELEKEFTSSRSFFQEELKRLQDEVLQSKAELASSKKAFEEKDNELHGLSEQLHLARLQHCHYEESVCNLQGEVMFLGLKLQNLKADSKKSNKQLKDQFYKCMDEWMAEKVNLLLQIKCLEEQLQTKPFAESTSSKRVSESVNIDKSHMEDRDSASWFSSGSPHGSIQSLVELGEAFHAGEEELQHLRTKLKEVETRESNLALQLQSEMDESAKLKEEMGNLKEELRAEKEKAREESEDMAQEMAELRYQSMEMLEIERDLRARTEQASLSRVEELETQVDRARQQLVAALARRREAEQHSEDLEAAMQEVKATLEGECHQKQECIDAVQRDKQLLELRLHELENKFTQLENEKKLLERQFFESVESWKPCFKKPDAANNKISMEVGRLAEWELRMPPCPCHSDLPDSDGYKQTMTGAQEISDCRYSLKDTLHYVDRQELMENFGEKIVASEGKSFHYQKVLVEGFFDVEKAVLYALKVDIELLVVSSSFELEITNLTDKLSESEKEALESKEIQEEKELEMQQVWDQLERFKLDFFQYQESVVNLEDEIAILREELSRSDAEWGKSYDQLDQKHAERVNQWANEKLRSLLKSAQVEEHPQQVPHSGDDCLQIAAIAHSNSCQGAHKLQEITSSSKEKVPSYCANTLRETEGSFQDLVALGEASLAWV